jgi:hypothetical protein
MHIRDRIKDLRRVRAGDLRPHPKNWRTHPKAQQEGKEQLEKMMEQLQAIRKEGKKSKEE